MRMIGILLGAFFFAGVASVSFSEANPHGPAVTTEHSIRVDGQKLNYVAEIGSVPIRDVETGEPHGFMYYTAYRVPSDAPRPLIFVWNGGPGAASTLLHFEAFGPRRIEGDRLVVNSETLLTDADLVFVDPIGTGFSRPAKPEYAAEFYGTLGDIASVTEFVRAWRLLHDASDAPLYLMGESWGAGRAGSVGHALEELGIRVSGLVLISGGSGLKPTLSEDLQKALRVVSYLPAVHYHNKLPDQDGAGFDEILKEAEAWARGVYAPALSNIDALSPSERDAVAEKLALYTGIDVDVIDRATLTVTPRQFRAALFPDDDTRLNIFDMRLITGQGEERDNSILSNYLRRELGYRTDLPYIGLDGGFERGYAPSGETPPSVGARWDYFTAPMSEEEKQAAIAEAIRVGGGPPRGGPRLPSAQEAVDRNPDMKVLVASGMYDSLASCAANREVSSRLEGALKEAFAFKCYEGGHMMYRDAAAHVRLRNDVKALIAASQ